MRTPGSALCAGEAGHTEDACRNSGGEEQRSRRARGKKRAGCERRGSTWAARKGGARSKCAVAQAHPLDSCNVGSIQPQCMLGSKRRCCAPGGGRIRVHVDSPLSRARTATQGRQAERRRNGTQRCRAVGAGAALGWRARQKGGRRAAPGREPAHGAATGKQAAWSKRRAEVLKDDDSGVSDRRPNLATLAPPAGRLQLRTLFTPLSSAVPRVPKRCPRVDDVSGSASQRDSAGLGGVLDGGALSARVRQGQHAATQSGRSTQ